MLGVCSFSYVYSSAFYLPAKEADPQLAMGENLVISPTCEVGVVGSLRTNCERAQNGPGIPLHGLSAGPTLEKQDSFERPLPLAQAKLSLSMDIVTEGRTINIRAYRHTVLCIVCHSNKMPEDGFLLLCHRLSHAYKFMLDNGRPPFTPFFIPLRQKQTIPRCVDKCEQFAKMQQNACINDKIPIVPHSRSIVRYN